jgi:signal transduction histidine kinase
MDELHHGNLKARILVDRNDEIGQAMARFNRMTDEIERLVEHLQGVEKSRMVLLQELAHDLRTPVASLKNLVEVVQRKDAVLDSKLRRELLELAGKEIDYFERLVEDLLVLAQINEPNYQPEPQPIPIADILEEVAETVAHQFSGSVRPIRFRKAGFAGNPQILGDVHLVRRMLRNALVNAYTHARTEVSAVLDFSFPGQVVVRIEDDGSGFTPEMLSAFGERRMGRTISKDKDGTLRAGLGAMILKKIARVHKGTVQATNREGPASEVIGARVEISLPLA